MAGLVGRSLGGGVPGLYRIVPTQPVDLLETANVRGKLIVEALQRGIPKGFLQRLLRARALDERIQERIEALLVLAVLVVL